MYISANIMAHYKIRMQRLRWLLLNKSNLDGSMQLLTEWVRGVREKCIYSLPRKKMIIFGHS